MLLSHRVCSLARSPSVIDCSRIIQYRVIFNRPHLLLMLPNPNETRDDFPFHCVLPEMTLFCMLTVTFFFKNLNRK